MTGDGVNDVLALKDADMGIAMGAGSAASRAVAQLVLLDNKFSVLPGVLAEGRQGHQQRRAGGEPVHLRDRLLGLHGAHDRRHRHRLPVPAPAPHARADAQRRHPGRRPRPRSRSAQHPSGFLPRVVRFAIPAGVIAAVAALTTYLVTRSFDDSTLREARSAATVCLLGVGLGILVRLTGSLPPWRWVLVGAMALGIVIVMVTPFLSTFFDLEYPPSDAWWVLLACVAVGNVAIRFVPVAGDDHD